mmetsp:Transcript_14292/g.19821  ORF Transcript_14292/g.19821 Transcript_14292/m.19821 type:complete len:84 (-) Transcript_14292:159-410(-)
MLLAGEETRATRVLLFGKGRRQHYGSVDGSHEPGVEGVDTMGDQSSEREDGTGCRKVGTPPLGGDRGGDCSPGCGRGEGRGAA